MERLDDEFIAAFEEGFYDAMPSDYSLNEDRGNDVPWCNPWLGDGNDWFREDVSPYAMGKAWAEEVVGEWEACMADNGNRLTEDEERNSEITLDGLTATLPTSRDAYFRWYDGQACPQGAFLEIDPVGKTLVADWNPEIGNAVSDAVFNGRILRYGFPCTLPLRDVRELVEEAAPYAARVVKGYSEEWDGGKAVGVLDDDAREAAEAIEALCNGNPVPKACPRP